MLQLSTNGRNVMSLTTLGTGVTNMLPSFNGVTAQGSSTEINFNGSRYDHNNWLIDGGEVYDRGSGGKLDAAISPDALGKFRCSPQLHARLRNQLGRHGGDGHQIRNAKIPWRTVGV